ncbi:MAG TPA: polyphosphate kinase 1 [Casimicrobiaceae bacterium]|nr:polyphosphate kinase 1 [Casimicrobiaceae bacterium]
MNDRTTESELRGTIERKALLEHAWLDRDLGWLAFNDRVLHEAFDERTPLLERLKFLAIVTSNLDEFFMKRVGMFRGKALIEDREDPLSREGDARTRLLAIRAIVLKMLDEQAGCYKALLPLLAAHGIVIATWEQLSPAQVEEASAYFDNHVSPALTPLSFDPAHPFPFMSNLSTNWAFVIASEESIEPRIVRVKIPPELPAWFELKADVPADQRRFLALEELIYRSANKLLPGMTIISGTLFRILRNAELDLEDDEGESLRDVVSDAVRQRRFEPVVRVDFGPNADPVVRLALMERFELTDLDVFELPGMLDYPDLFQIAALDIPGLRDSPWTPQSASRLADPESDIFTAIDAGDILVHHPYESFDSSVERFIHEAADDPRTLAIKMTVYRVGDDTPFVRSLVQTAEAGKQVACVIELTARFDEARNLHWAQQLEKVGAHVTYGVLGLKTHTKIALVVLQHGMGLRCYAHIGTGNYHVKTARSYTDVGLLTADPAITADIVNLFHYLTGHSTGPQFQKLLVAPMNMRQRFLEMIAREASHCEAGRKGHIIAKLNQVDDLEITSALVAASRAGVKIDLIVRGFCCLRAGVPGWTDNVRVRSIIGRFLEHSRIFYFSNGEQDPLAGEFYIGSADWMMRNLSQRVEAATPIKDRPLRERLWEILQACLEDSRQAWVMEPDGTYRQQQPPADGKGAVSAGAQAWLMELTRRRAAGN